MKVQLNNDRGGFKIALSLYYLLVMFNYSLVLESFEDYVAVETLDGENKYDAGDHGMQVGYTAWWMT